MTTSLLTSSTLRRTVTHLAVAGAAVLAAMFTLAPPVAADDDTTGSDTTTEPTSDTTPSEQPTTDAPPADTTPSDPTPTEQPTNDQTPAESTDASQSTGTDPAEPGEAEPAPAEPTSTEGLTASVATATDPEAAARQAELAAVEPDFGYTKFRVGVQLADGSFVPAGATTLGSEITIVETGPSVPGGTKNTTCTTTAFLDPGNPTASYCQNLNPGGGPFADYYLAMLDSILTITQTSVNENLEITDGTKTVVPTCDDFPACLFINTGDVLLTDTAVRDRDDGDDDDDSDHSDKADGSDEAAALPDTGGEDPRLLAYGVGLIVGGGSLLAFGRRRRAYESQH